VPTRTAPVADRPAKLRVPPRGRKRKSDITLPPAFIDKMKVVSKRDGITLFEWQRLAVLSYARHLAKPENQFEPRPLKCDACQRAFTAPRSQGDHKRLRASVNFDTDTIEILNWIADTFYYRVWSQAFEAAVKFFLGKDAPPIEPTAR
jgi:hypothetical protein